MISLASRSSLFNYREGRRDWQIDLAINETTKPELFIMKGRPARVTDPEAYGLRYLTYRARKEFTAMS